MKVSTFTRLSLTSIACATFLSLNVASCGKEEKKKEHKSKPVLTQSGVSDGKASITFAPNADMQCRVVWANKAGEWQPCPTGSYSYPMQKGESIYLEARQGINGDSISQKFDASQMPLGPTPSDVGSTNIVAPTGPLINLSQTILAGNRVFSVPPSMRLLRYSTSFAPRFQTVVSVMDPTMRDWIPQTMCEKAGGVAPSMAGISFEVLPNVQSSPSGATATYCSYRTSSTQFYQQLEDAQMARDQIEIASLPSGQSFEYISASVFTEQRGHPIGQDIQHTQDLFNKLCSRSNSGVKTQPAPVLSGFNNVPGYGIVAPVRVCQNVDLTMGYGQFNGRVDLVMFEYGGMRGPRTPCDGAGCPTPDLLRFVHVLDSNSRSVQETVAHMVDRSLNSLKFYVR